MKTVKIDNKQYQVLQSEFAERQTEYSNLNILEKVGNYDRIASLISNISNKMQCRSAVFGSITHGGYIPINASVHTNFLFDCSLLHQDNITSNIENNKQYIFLSDLSIINEAFIRRCVLYTEIYESKYDEFVLAYVPIIVSNKPFMEGYVSYSLSHTDTMVLIPNHLNETFAALFSMFINEHVLNYDNLINLCVMVKNGGDTFVSMLESCIPFIDRWTILDTGSTDDTIENVRRVMAGKDGALYQEPFINFGVSRNRCLELAGTQSTYNIMLDDTYHLKGDIRKFLQFVRGDQNADSFSLYITQSDVQYASNRIFKSKRNLKYKYAIHEVIDETNNLNILIPKEHAFIYDLQTDELNGRTLARKQQDIVMLHEEIDSNPDDPRPYYYMAQTYSGMEQFENAYDWFLKRINHQNAGFEQEKHEACLEAGRIAQFILNRPPADFLKHYELANKVDPERPDSLYFLGAYYYKTDPKKAFEYLWRGFKLGFPSHRQYCLKPSITYTHIPKLLIDCCYNLGEYSAGNEASAFYLEHNKSSDEVVVVLSWNKIFSLLVHSMKIKESIGNVAFSVLDKPICCFIAPCGFHEWTGSDILKMGIGGSESMVVELATRLKNFNVIVFCNCAVEETYENVRYIPLQQLFYMLHSQFIHTCIVSRYSEYLPVVINSEVENVFLMTHDTAFSGNVITINPKLKGVLCLSEWHAQCITAQYSALIPFIKIIGHGIDVSKISASPKIPYKFIYSSLANRGLHNLLMLWPKIVHWQPSATLCIYSDIDSKYMLDNYGDEMNKIRHLVNTTPGIIYHGYVDKQTLFESWKTADVWFYPTAFNETFCVSALEAAASGTLAIATNVAALKETISDRGVLLDNLDQAVETIIRVMENQSLKKSLIDANYEWAIGKTWESQTVKLEELLMMNMFEGRGLPNWMDGVDVRKQFIDIFNEHVKPTARIVEVGVGAGLSLLSMMGLVKDSTGVAIYDCMHANKLWCSFDANVRHSGFVSRVAVIKSESTFNGLLLLLNDAVDVIYLNNKSEMLDCYAELSVAWAALKVGGLLVIDNLLDKRNIALTHLLNKCKNASVLLRDESRAFVLKG